VRNLLWVLWTTVVAGSQGDSRRLYFTAAVVMRLNSGQLSPKLARRALEAYLLDELERELVRDHREREILWDAVRWVRAEEALNEIDLPPVSW